MTRRSFFVTTSAAFCAPAVLRAANLMPLRGIILPFERNYFGFLDRLWVNLHLPKITQLYNDGFSAHEIASELNRMRWTAINGNAWDVQHVLGVARRNQQIQRGDPFSPRKAAS